MYASTVATSAAHVAQTWLQAEERLSFGPALSGGRGRQYLVVCLQQGVLQAGEIDSKPPPALSDHFECHRLRDHLQMMLACQVGYNIAGLFGTGPSLPVPDVHRDPEELGLI